MSAALAKIHIAKKDCGLDDDSYRDFMERVTGKRSAKDLTPAEAAMLLDEFKRHYRWVPTVVQGGKKARNPESTKARKPAEHPTARKARALWISLWQLGVVYDRSERALEAFGRQQLKCDALAWANGQQMYKLIEALKAMANRNGWSQFLPMHDPMPTQTLMRRLVRAQVNRLAQRHRVIVPGVITSSIENADDATLARLADDLGKQIRGAQ